MNIIQHLNIFTSKKVVNTCINQMEDINAQIDDEMEDILGNLDNFCSDTRSNSDLQMYCSYDESKLLKLIDRRKDLMKTLKDNS